MNKIKYINENDYNRIFVISDLHGNYHALLQFIKKVHLKTNDLLLILGDSCDRNIYVFEIYNLVKQLQSNGYNVSHLLGNHEKAMLDFVNTDVKSNDMLKDYLYCYSSYYTINSFFKHYKGTFDIHLFVRSNFLKLLNLYDFINDFPVLVIGNNNLFFHAGYDVNELANQQDENILLSNRSFFSTGIGYDNKTSFSGHTINKNGIKFINNSYFIDMGVSFTNKLAYINVKNKDCRILNVKLKNYYLGNFKLRYKIFKKLFNRKIKPILKDKVFITKYDLYIGNLNESEFDILFDFLEKYKYSFFENGDYSFIDYSKNEMYKDFLMD